MHCSICGSLVTLFRHWRRKAEGVQRAEDLVSRPAHLASGCDMAECFMRGVYGVSQVVKDTAKCVPGMITRIVVLIMTQRRSWRKKARPKTPLVRAKISHSCIS